MTTRPHDPSASGLVVPGFVVQAVCAALRDERVDVVSLTQALGLEVGGDGGAFERLPFLSFARMMRAASNAARNPLLGLRVGERLGESSLHMLGPLIVASPSLRAGIAAVDSLQDALFGGPLWQHVERDGELHFGPAHGLEQEADLRVAVDLSLTLAFRITQRFVGAPHGQELSAQLFGAACEPRAAYVAIFGPRVRFDAPYSALRLPLSALDRARPGTDPGFASTLRQMINERFEAAGSSDESWSERLKRALSSEDTLAQVDIDAIAARWHMSPRTLRRKVEQEGTTVSAILNGVRFERARQELTSHGAPLRDVAERLGYTDVSTFHRAFKRWAGIGPGAYRTRSGKRSEPQ